jgi:hypothetical protein
MGNALINVDLIVKVYAAVYRRVRQPQFFKEDQPVRTTTYQFGNHGNLIEEYSLGYLLLILTGEIKGLVIVVCTV